MKDLRFPIIDWVNEKGEKGFALAHCPNHQPYSDPEIKQHIDSHVFSFRLMGVTGKTCKECAIKMREEFEAWMERNNI